MSQTRPGLGVDAQIDALIERQRLREARSRNGSRRVVGGFGSRLQPRGRRAEATPGGLREHKGRGLQLSRPARSSIEECALGGRGIPIG